MSRTINELNTTDTLEDADKFVIWQDTSQATRAITAADMADYFSLAGGPFQPLDELLTAIAAQGPNTANGDFIQLTGQDTVRVRKLTVATYAALTVISATFRFDDMLVYVSSRATDGDGGQGWWRFDAASSATANGGTILAPDAGTGRWLRLYNDRLYVEQFGAIGNGTTNDNTAITAAMTAASLAGVILAGVPGKIYAVSGEVTVPGKLFLEDLHLKQLTPTSSTSLRTLLSSGYSGHRWKRVTVDINGNGTYGSIEDYRGISIASGSDMILEDIEVFGNNIASALVLNACEDVQLVRPYVHDIAYVLGSDPGDDRINGIRVIAGKNVSIIDAVARDLTGDFGTGSKRRYTRGITVSGGTQGLNIRGGRVENIDQGIDITGSDGAVDFLIEGVLIKKPNSWGIKIANSPKRGKVIGNHVVEAGYGAYVVSGLADDTNRPEEILFSGNTASGMDSASTFVAQTDRFFYGALTGGAAGNGRPRFVQFRDNFGSVPTAGTAPNYEFYADYAATTTNGGALWSGGQTSGGSTSKFGGNAGYTRADVTLSASQSITTANETKVAFDSETYDPMGLHDGAGVFLAPRDGLYGYNCIILWDNSATGTRRLVLRKNATNERGEDRQQGENASIGQSQNLSGMIYLDASDTIQFRAEQTTGGAINIVNTGARASFWLISN